MADIPSSAHHGRMTNYAAVDATIDAWVKATGSMLFTEWAGQPARFFHLPGKPPFGCFQVSVEPSSADAVTVLARAIDTNEDSELELQQTWQGSVGELDAMLSAAVATIDTWKQRPQAERR